MRQEDIVINGPVAGKKTLLEARLTFWLFPFVPTMSLGFLIVACDTTEFSVEIPTWGPVFCLGSDIMKNKYMQKSKEYNDDVDSILANHIM